MGRAMGLILESLQSKVMRQTHGVLASVLEGKTLRHKESWPTSHKVCGRAGHLTHVFQAPGQCLNHQAILPSLAHCHMGALRKVHQNQFSK